MNRAIYSVLGISQIFTSLAGLICGLLFIMAPDGRLIGAPLRLLQHTPFSDFLIPGIILFLVNGVGQGIAGVLTFRMHRSAGLVGGVFAMGLMIWIFVQVNMIGGRDGLQYTFFGIGVLQAALAFFADRALYRVI